MALSGPEHKLWEQLNGERGNDGVPKAVCSAIRPFPFWGVIASIVIFLPLALILSFVLKRYALLVQGDELLISELGFWRMRPIGEPQRIALGSVAVGREGSAVVVGETKYHLQPGWEEPADRIVKLAGR